jgi:hypothetical protein
MIAVGGGAATQRRGDGACCCQQDNRRGGEKMGSAMMVCLPLVVMRLRREAITASCRTEPPVVRVPSCDAVLLLQVPAAVRRTWMTTQCGCHDVEGETERSEEVGADRFPPVTGVWTAPDRSLVTVRMKRRRLPPLSALQDRRESHLASLTQCHSVLRTPIHYCHHSQHEAAQAGST